MKARTIFLAWAIALGVSWFTRSLHATIQLPSPLVTWAPRVFLAVVPILAAVLSVERPKKVETEAPSEFEVRPWSFMVDEPDIERTKLKFEGRPMLEHMSMLAVLGALTLPWNLGGLRNGPRFGVLGVWLADHGTPRTFRGYADPFVGDRLGVYSGTILAVAAALLVCAWLMRDWQDNRMLVPVWIAGYALWLTGSILLLVTIQSLIGAVPRGPGIILALLVPILGLFALILRAVHRPEKHHPMPTPIRSGLALCLAGVALALTVVALGMPWAIRAVGFYTSGSASMPSRYDAVGLLEPWGVRGGWFDATNVNEGAHWSTYRSLEGEHPSYNSLGHAFRTLQAGVLFAAAAVAAWFARSAKLRWLPSALAGLATVLLLIGTIAVFRVGPDAAISQDVRVEWTLAPLLCAVAVAMLLAAGILWLWSSPGQPARLKPILLGAALAMGLLALTAPWGEMEDFSNGSAPNLISLHHWTMEDDSGSWGHAQMEDIKGIALVLASEPLIAAGVVVWLLAFMLARRGENALVLTIVGGGLVGLGTGFFYYDADLVLGQAFPDGREPVRALDRSGTGFWAAIASIGFAGGSLWAKR